MLGQDVSRTPQAPTGRRDLVLEELGEEGILYDREGALVHILNVTALFIWRRCDGTNTVDAISEALRRAFNVAGGVEVRRDVETAVTVFAERGLLEAT
jgi:hypothetical protein